MGFYTSRSGCTCSFLFFDFTCTTYDFSTFFCFVRPLAFVCQMLFNVQINGVIVWFNTEDSFIKLDFLPVSFPSMFNTLIPLFLNDYVSVFMTWNTSFYYKKILFSYNFYTLRFCTFTLSLPI